MTAAAASVPAVPPSSVAEVIARMEAIVADGPPRDGVAAFASLYLAVTRGVQAELAAANFADPRFLERLDIVFAGLFFDAYSSFRRDPGKAPRAWTPLFRDRARKDIAPLQFALAGMNAHINRDLPVALVRTCAELGIEPAKSSNQHADFQRVNGLLARVEQQIKQAYLTGPLATIDRLLHRLHRIDDVVAMWDIEQARSAAWNNGQALWALRGDPDLAAAFLDTLDGTVGFAGRGLLIPAQTLVSRVVGFLRRLF